MFCVTLGLLFLLPFRSDGTEWNSLKVRWGINRLSNFNAMPRTVGDASEAGFTQDGSCGDTDAKFRGNRYVKDGDRAVMLLYDNDGIIAGIQTGIPVDMENGYPSSDIQPPWVRDADLYLITVYFVDPSNICATSRGLTKSEQTAELNERGTGTDLYLQNGSTPLDVVKLPDTETVATETLWTKGKCYYTMAKWNNLKVTWGINPFGNFNAMPRTVGDATEAGFTQDGSCGDSDAKFRGNRYLKDGDRAVMLLYDNDGIIAGIQIGIPANLENGYPSTDIQPPWVRDGDLYLITAYFVDPSNICATSRGLTKSEQTAELNERGTGTDLYLQNGSTPLDVVKLPDTETAAAETLWTKGKCFFTMGKHYWYNIRSDMDCGEFVPVFLLYNGGKLNGFGWAMMANVTSSRYEHPPTSAIKAFMDPVPTCVEDPTIYLSTMHIYLTKRPLLNFC